MNTKVQTLLAGSTWHLRGRLTLVHVRARDLVFRDPEPENVLIDADGHALSAEAPLFLGQTIKYVVLTFVLHVIYGGLNGTLIARWMGADGARTGRRRSGPGTR